MKLSILALASLAVFTSAQDQYYDVQSSPFRLILRSDDTSLNGTALGACHQGAAIEGLCRTGQTLADEPSAYTTFYHNVSSSRNNIANEVDAVGILNWILHANLGALIVPSAMFFFYSIGTNIAIPTFMPDWDRYDLVQFDECGHLYVGIYQDDTVLPPGYYDPALKLKNWYICLTRYSYTYETLVFKVGVQGEPQNPSCKKVEVERVWV